MGCYSNSGANYSSQTQLIEAAGLQSFIIDGHTRRIKCILQPAANPKIRGARQVQELKLPASRKRPYFSGRGRFLPSKSLLQLSHPPAKISLSILALFSTTVLVRYFCCQTEIRCWQTRGEHEVSDAVVSLSC